MIINCLNCGTKRDVSPSEIKRGAKYCSPECSQKVSFGHKVSDETRRKIKEANKNNLFTKGHVPWNTGTVGIMIAWNKGLQVCAEGQGANWKGEDVGYSGLHMWVRKHLGKARKCENNSCIYPRKNKNNQVLISPRIFEWANMSGKYKRDLSDWMQLCPSCHRKYDFYRNKSFDRVFL